MPDRVRRWPLILTTMLEFVTTTLTFLVFLAMALFGACYNGCNELSDFLPALTVSPFLIPVVASAFAVGRAILRHATSRIEQALIFLFAFAAFCLATYASIADPGDIWLYLPVAVAALTPTILAAWLWTHGTGSRVG